MTKTRILDGLDRIDTQYKLFSMGRSLKMLCFLCTELTKHIAMAAPWAGESRKFLACFSMSLSLLIMLLSGLVANKTLRAS